MSVIAPGQSDPRVRITVPCGKCVACLSNRRSEWVTRLEQELRYSMSAHFVTLTYVDPPLGGYDIPSLCKKDVQDFMKRLRKRRGKGIKYFLTGEYGSQTVRPHYHAIMFNLGVDPLELLVDSWQNGLVHVGTVTPASMKYTLKYIVQGNHDSTLYEYVEKPFTLISKGIGLSYVKKRKSWHKRDIERNYVVKSDGVKARLPRYFRDKIYTSSDKQKQKMMYEKKRLEEQGIDLESREYYKAEVEGKVAFEASVRRRLKDGSKL